jgi:phosphatidylinositol alpha-1,6-mannosyltransferase
MAWSAIAAIRRINRRLRPTIILAGHWSGAHAALRAAGGGVPVVSAVHGREVRLRPLTAVPPAQRIYDRIRTHVFANAAALVCVSRFTRQQMRDAGVDEHRLHVVCNGVDVRHFQVPTGRHFFGRYGLSDRRILLTVARLVSRKGIDTVIEALPAILRREPSAVYTVIGSGPDRTRLESIAMRHGVLANVHFLGAVGEPDLIDAYQNCDLFIMPARDEGPDVEGFGLVFLEAGACGKPVVGSRAGGIPDAVADEETGILVDPSSCDQVADAVVRILSDSELAARLGEAGREFATTQRSWAMAASELTRIFAVLAAGRVTARGGHSR